MQQLNGKIALITGAGRGIGRATAHAFAKEGIHIGLVGRTKSHLNEVANELKDYNINTLVVTADVADQASIQTTTKKIEQTLGPIDILINNAGIGKFGSFMDLSPEDMQNVFNVNVMGMFHATQAVLPSMIERKSGDIINISSTSGLRGTEGSAAYSASKFAVLGMSEALTKEVRKHNIRVQTLTPSTVITDFGGINKMNEEKAAYYMQAEDVAEVIISQLKLNPRMFVKQAELWGTNPQ
ncbi:3-ketoacyl-ACP reductase [Bacillus sp. JCM 19041]|uniref:3-ketoacyl-ACP reductase n=1 Tax=Bacillus sp. JCM 19041 TaxID=1460637 RepID=UPI0006D20876